MTFSSSLSDLIAAREQADLAAELGELTHRLIELESDRRYLEHCEKIAAVKGRIEELRGELGQEQKASQA